MILIALTATPWHFELASQEDFKKVTEVPHGSFYMTTDIKINAFGPSGLYFKGEFFGNSHTLTLSEGNRLFETLENAVFENVSISIEDNSVFSNNTVDSVFVESKIASTYLFLNVTRYGRFKSVEFDCQEEMFYLIYDSQFTGCKAYGTQFANLSHNNNYTRMYMDMNRQYNIDPDTKQEKFGALANTMVFDKLEQCAMILKITGIQSGDITIGGLAGEGLSMIVKHCDFAVNLELEKCYGNVGGLFGDILTNDTDKDVRSFHNITIALNLKTQPGRDDVESYRAYKGGLAGMIEQKQANLLGISVFVDAELVEKSPLYCTIFGGLAGIIDEANNIVACAIFGKVTTFSHAALVGGFAGSARGGDLEYSTAVSRCVSNIAITVNAGLNVSIGGYIGFIDKQFKFEQCESLGSIELNLGQINSTKSTAIAIGGFSSSLMPGTEIIECYTTVTINAKAENGLILQPLVIGGLLAYLDGANVKYCMVYIKEITTSVNFAELYFGGFFGMTNRTAVTVTSSYAYISKVDLKYTINDQVQVRVGGVVGKTAGEFTVRDSFVQMNLSIAQNEHDNVLIGELAGDCTSANMLGQNYLAINYTDASGHLLDLSGAEDPTINVENIFVDCSLRGNLGDGERCTNDMHSKEFAEESEWWEYMTDGNNNNYPSLLETFYVDNKGSFASPDPLFNYKNYYLDSGLAFPEWAYDFCTGVCVGTFVSPLNFECTSDTGDYCISEEMQDTLKKDICSFISDGEVCTDGMPTCQHNYDFLGDKIYCETSCTACENGYCNAGKCLCNQSITGEACDRFSCSLSENPCNGLGTCFQDRCACKDGRLIYVWEESKCVMGCPDLIPSHGECVSEGKAICTKKFAGEQCNDCADGFEKLGQDCMIPTQYGGAIAAIVISVLFVILAIVFGIYAFVNYEKKKKALSLHDALKTGVINDAATFI